MIKQSIMERLKPYGWADKNPIFGSVNAAVLRLKTKDEVRQFFDEYVEFIRQQDEGRTAEEAKDIAVSNIGFSIYRAVYPEVERAVEVGVARSLATGNLETRALIDTVEQTATRYNSFYERYALFTEALPELGEAGFY